MNVSPKHLGFGFLLIVGGVALYAWYQTIEWEDEEYDLPPRAIAFRNDYLAASRLLEEHHYTLTQPSYGIVLNELPKQDTDIMWLSELDSTMQAGRVEALFDWIKAGGHLLSTIDYEPYDPEYEQIPALYGKLQEHQIEVWSQFSDEYGFDLGFDYRKDDDEDDVEVEPIEIRVPDGPTIDVEISNDTYFTSEHPRAIMFGSTPQAHALVTQPIGQGHLTLLNSTEAFANFDGIGKADNAYLLLWLSNQTDANSIAIIENTRTVPGLMATLWAKAPMVILTLLAVLLGWVIYASRRLGPVEVDYDHGRSNLLSHLTAKAQFWRRHGRLDTLLEPLRTAALEKIRPQTIHGAKPDQDDTLSNEELDYAATLANCSRSTIKTALLQDKLSNTDFNNSVSVLRHLLKHRTSGPSRL